MRAFEAPPAVLAIGYAAHCFSIIAKSVVKKVWKAVLSNTF